MSCSPTAPVAGMAIKYAKNHVVVNATVLSVNADKTVNLKRADTGATVNNVQHSCEPVDGKWGCGSEACDPANTYATPHF